MSAKNLLKGLEAKEMLRCDGCGGYHPVDECEVVVLRLVKGKNCELNTSRPTETTKPFGDITTETLPNPVATETILPKKNIIPPAVMSMMYPPGHEEFEHRGAKERRT